MSVPLCYLLEADGGNQLLDLGDVRLLCVFLGQTLLLGPRLELGLALQVQETGGLCK